MKRLLIGCAVVAIGCVGRKLAEVEKDLSAATAEEGAIQKNVNKASAEVADAERYQEGEQARLTRATRSLVGYQPNVARRWESNPKKLQALKKEHPMPAALLAALDAAQASGKDSTPEKLFELSLTAGKLTDAAALIDGWEATEFSYTAEEPPDDCTPEVPKLKCRSNGKLGMLLCDGTENTWLVWSDHGTLFTRSAPLVGLEVADRPAPGVWVLKKGVERNLYVARTVIRCCAG